MVTKIIKCTVLICGTEGYGGNIAPPGQTVLQLLKKQVALGILLQDAWVSPGRAQPASCKPNLVGACRDTWISLLGSRASRHALLNCYGLLHNMYCLILLFFWLKINHITGCNDSAFLLCLAWTGTITSSVITVNYNIQK